MNMRLCPICGRLLQPYGEIFRCRNCHLFADLRQPVRYDDDYLLHYKLYREKTELSGLLQKARWDFVRRYTPTQRLVLLDYGCGARAFGDANESGLIRVFNYDPHFYKDHGFLKADVDVLTMWDSLEHMSRLDIVPLIGAEWVFLSLPIVDEVEDIFTWKHYVPREHIWYFSENALRLLFRKWGYRMLVRQDIEAELRSKDIASFCFMKLQHKEG